MARARRRFALTLKPDSNENLTTPRYRDLP